jgi:hypothetical protein
VKSTRRTNYTDAGLLCSGLLKGGPATRALAFLLVVSPLPVQARPLSNPLPGGSFAGGPGNRHLDPNAAIAVEFYVKMHKQKNAKARLDMNPMNFVIAIVPGRPAKLIVPVTNLLDAPLTIKEIAVEDKSGALTLGGGHLTMILLAPGEKYEIPVILSTNSGRGKARVRIAAASEQANKEEVEFVEIAYNRTSKQVPPGGKSASVWRESDGILPNLKDVTSREPASRTSLTLCGWRQARNCCDAYSSNGNARTRLVIGCEREDMEEVRGRDLTSAAKEVNS